MIGERVKLLRNKLNMSQKKFSNSLGIKQASLSHYETCRREMPTSLLQKVLSYTKCNGTWLLTGTGPMFMDSAPEKDTVNNVHARVSKERASCELSAEEIKDLHKQIRELKKKVAAMREDNTHLRHESEEANRELRATMKKVIRLQEMLLEK